MAVDRGGLNYKIAVGDQFSSNTKKFRKEIAAARQEWSKFRADMAKPVSTGAASEAAKLRRELRQTTRDQTQFSKEQKKFSKEELATQKRIAKESREQRAREREAIKIRRTQASDAARQTRIEAQLARQKAATERRNATARRQAVREAERERRALERAVNARVRAIRATKSGVSAQRSLTSSVRETESAVNRVSFTFRRLFGILAAFAAAREGFRGFVGLIKGAINFNRQVEDSQIALAGIIAATGKISDNQGRVLEGAEKFAAAMEEAKIQTQALRQDSLRTIATYGELMVALRAGTAAGLETGQLQMNQIREITIWVSQAAAAINLAQNQLTEEIRSLLRGTIQQRTSLVAATLGITPEDIRRAKETGTLYEFLKARLQGFALAAKETQQTVTGMAARIRDAFLYVSGIAAVPAYKELKGLLKDIFESLVNIKKNAKGVIEEITPRPEILKAFRQLFNGLKSLIVDFRAGLASVDIEPLMASLGRIFSGLSSVNLGDTLDQAVRLAAVFIDLLAAALKTGAAIVGALLPFANVLKVLGPILSIVIQVRVVMGAIRFISKELVGLFALFPIHLTRAQAAAARMNTQLTLSQKASRALGLGLGLTALLSQSLLSIFGDIHVSIQDSIDLLFSSFADALDSLITKAQVLALRVAEAGGLSPEVQKEKGRLKAWYDFGMQLNASFWTGMVGGLISEKWGKKMLDAISRDMLKDDALVAAAGSLGSKIEEKIARIESQRQQRRKEFEEKVANKTDRRADKLALEKQRLEQMNELMKKLNKQGKDFQGKDLDVTGEKRVQGPTPQEELALGFQLSKTMAAQSEIQAQKELLELKKAGASRDALALKEAQLKLDVLKDQIFNERAIIQAKINQQEKIIKNVQGSEREAFERLKLLALQQEQNKLTEEHVVKLGEAEFALRRLALVAEGTFLQGLVSGLKGFTDEFASTFQAGVNVIKNTVSSLAQFISQNIVDAFDPTTDTTLEERIGQFLKQIAQMVLQQMIQLAIAKAILGLGGSGLASAIGFAEGGEVPDKKAPAAPPKGVSRKDTVNAWLQPGEFVQKLSAVRKYGSDIMKALNEGVIDPRALRVLAFGNRGRRSAAFAHASAGYAEGGLVTKASRANIPNGKAQSSETQIPGLFFSKQQMERALAGGAGVALKRWLRDNNEEIGQLSNSNRR
jgi:hypothetical protein